MRRATGQDNELKIPVARAALLTMISVNAHADISTLDWMTGCWTLNGQEEGSIEQWSSPAGKSMLGFNRVVSDGRTVAFEYLRIIEDDDGALALIASPSGQETARFELTGKTGNKAVFENPAHDFPQRIIYRLDDGGNLLGRIEGTIDGVPRAADFPMTRTSCDKSDAAGQE